MTTKPSNIRHIYWFAHYNLNSPSVRYRGKYALDYLKEHYGIGYSFCYPGYRPLTIAQFLKGYFSALFRRSASLVVVQRVHSNRIYANALKILIRIRPANTVYDLDDADYLEHPEKTIRHFLQNCSICTMGSKELISYANKLNPRIVYQTSPTCEIGHYKTHRNSILNIGWIGCFGGGHKESLLRYLFPAIRNLPFRIKLTILGVSSNEEKTWLHSTYNNGRILLETPADINWLDEEELQKRLSGFDIGIATLLDDELHRSKSAFKLKQYLTCGVPVLSSEIGENRYFLKDGINGFFCNTPNDFRKRIIQIHEMKDSEYIKICNSARESSLAFNLDKYVRNLIGLYTEIS